MGEDVKRLGTPSRRAFARSDLLLVSGGHKGARPIQVVPGSAAGGVREGEINCAIS